MKSIQIALFLVVLALATASDSAFVKFMKFTKEHNKKYANMQEFNERFNIFKQNLEKLDSLITVAFRAGPSTFSMGVTQFFDLSTDEFAEKYLNLDMSHLAQLKAKNAENVLTASADPAPASVDWRAKGAVSNVKNQGQCGSCWAFSAIGNIEGQYAIKNGKIQTFSEQQLVDCDKVDSGCNGGLMENAFTYFKQTGGIAKSEDYPYKGSQSKCNYDATKSIAKVTGFNFAGTEDENQIKSILATTGPLAIAINATPLQFYFWGIFNPWFEFICSPNSLNHGVLIVGYGVDGNTPYWIIKNSWGATWGEKGYFRIISGKGACGVNKYVISATVETA